MCGIAGIVARPGQTVNPEMLQRMCDVMVHRGPDDEGVLLHDNVGFGMRRLSIIDLHMGQQPIHNEDQTVWVVLNGEIYNYQSLREDLIAKGHRFYTQSDTEVIVHLYEEYGDEFVNYLSGMFAFALLDKPRRRLLIARDRIGEKQLFYSTCNGFLLFGSEIKCVLASGLVGKEIDRRALDDYLRYLYVPAPRTIYSQISELPPASMLVIEDGVLGDIVKYWTLAPAKAEIRTEQEAVIAVGEQLAKSVQSRMVSDVPIGALLSGGIDSSAVVAAMVKATSHPVKTFTIGYENSDTVYDERADARMIAEHLGTEHHEIVIRPDIVDLVPKIVRSFDQPFADSSAVANYYVFKETSQHVKVVLSGLGGDELFGGYERHLAIGRHAKLGWMPGWLKSYGLPWLAELMPDPRSGARHVDRIKRFVSGLKLSTAEAYQSYMTAFDTATRYQLLSPEVVDYIEAQEPEHPMITDFTRFGGKGAADAAMCVDVLNYLPGDLLTLTDRMSMQHSIEARAPLIDHELIDLAMSIPSSLHIAGREKKRILREVVRSEIPAEILDRPKRGFTIPVTNWFRNELQGYLRETLSKDRVRSTGLLNSDVVERLMNEHVSMRHNHHARLWSLVVFMNWYDEFIRT